MKLFCSTQVNQQLEIIYKIKFFLSYKTNEVKDFTEETNKIISGKNQKKYQMYISGSKQAYIST